ncbi:hypothetical protein AKJ65_05915, partial [candidate division MSBL1 archaeon SCGC-AAA259E19]
MPENLPEYGFRRLNRNELERIFERLPGSKEVESEEECREAVREAQKLLKKENSGKGAGPVRTSPRFHRNRGRWTPQSGQSARVPLRKAEGGQGGDGGG